MALEFSTCLETLQYLLKIYLPFSHLNIFYMCFPWPHQNSVIEVHRFFFFLFPLISVSVRLLIVWAANISQQLDGIKFSNLASENVSANEAAANEIYAKQHSHSLP